MIQVHLELPDSLEAYLRKWVKDNGCTHTGWIRQLLIQRIRDMIAAEKKEDVA